MLLSGVIAGLGACGGTVGSGSIATCSGTECVTSDVCTDVTCSGHGTCALTNGNAACQCNGGYHPSGLSCLPDGSGAVVCSPALAREGEYFGFAEQFNRYYTDCAWQPLSTVYVSPNGTGEGSSRASSAGVTTALAAVVPGRMVVFTAGTYSGCFELDSDHSGTYDNPIVLVGDRKADGSPDVTINCCAQHPSCR